MADVRERIRREPYLPGGASKREATRGPRLNASSSLLSVGLRRPEGVNRAPMGRRFSTARVSLRPREDEARFLDASGGAEDRGDARRIRGELRRVTFLGDEPLRLSGDAVGLPVHDRVPVLLLEEEVDLSLHQRRVRGGPVAEEERELEEPAARGESARDDV